MNNILIECSQNKAQQVFAPGDFEVQFAQPVALERGDRFALSKTFIDSETEEEGVVVIPKGGYTLSISVQPYIQYDDVAKFGNGGFAENLIEVDNAEYLLYKVNKDGAAPGADPLMELITEIGFEYKGSLGSKTLDWGNTDGAHPLKLIGTHITGETFPIFISLPALRTNTIQTAGGNVQAGDYKKTNLDIYTKILQQNPTNDPFNINADISLKVDNSDGSWTFNKIKPIYGITGENIGAYTQTRTLDPARGSYDLTPAVYDIPPFTIDEGKYTPDELCSTINNYLNDTTFLRKIEGITSTIGSNFLHQAYNLPMELTPLNVAPTDPTRYMLLPSNPRFEALPGSNGGVAGFPPIPDPLPSTPPLYQNWLVGTNLVELLYSSETDLYYWNYLHFPIYDETTAAGTIITRIKQVDGTTPLNSKYIQNGKNGGVIFSDLSATGIDPKTGETIPVQFWDGVLGFNVGGVRYNKTGLIPETNRFNNFSAGTANTYSATIPTLNDGKQMTNAGFVIDDIVNKQAYQTLAIKPDGSITTFEATSGFNNVIYATKALVSGGILDTGYYLIEIQLNFASNIVGVDSITKNITGIINRYYSKGSYVSAEGDSSFVISYDGESTLMSSMRIRVLNPDRTLADIGSDNTFFFELIKSNPEILL